MLCNIIEERFISSFETTPDPAILWQQYFCPIVNGTPTRDYIISSILKRPRDIIYLVNAAVTIAINRRHTRIEEEDIIEAEKMYSQYVFESVNVENTSPGIDIENVLSAFFGMPTVLTKNEILETLRLGGISDEMMEPTIDILRDLTFLGPETEENQFAFSEAPEGSRKNKILAWRFASTKGQAERFQIHKAFRAFLETKEV